MPENEPNSLPPRDTPHAPRPTPSIMRARDQHAKSVVIQDSSSSRIPSPMRITFLNPIGEVGGGERVLLASIRGAREHLPGARLDVVLFAGGPLEEEAERLGAAVTVVPLPVSLARLGDTRLRDNGRPSSLARLGLGGPPSVGPRRRSGSSCGCKRPSAGLRPDLIHSNGLKAHVFAAVARPRGVPVLWHLHDFSRTAR